MKRYYRKNRSSVALFLVSNLLAAGSYVFMSFCLARLPTAPWRAISLACGRSRL